VDGRPCVFLVGLHRAERAIAERLRRLREGRPPWPAIEAERAIPWVEARTGIRLAPSQQEAVRLALGSKVLVITGGPGVGKTTLVNALLKILQSRTSAIELAAPTGRAAKRLGEATGLEARTLHRLLEADPAGGGFKRNEEHPLEADLLVVDEVSMVDVPLMHGLLKAVRPRAALILVGDVDQLPSVGPGQVLADVIASGAVPVVRLTEVFRQAARSRIVTNAHKINQGLLPEPGSEPSSDFHLVRCREPEDGVAKLLEIVARRIPARFGLDPIRDIQVLCPMNRGGLGARSLNLELQRRLNPPGEVKVERFGWTFAPGDKVMQTANAYDKEVFNGDLGIVRRVELRKESSWSISRAARWSMASASWTNWCWPMPPRCTRARARSTRP
jgi:exodeoxyribonuclease V alpha subunit